MDTESDDIGKFWCFMQCKRVCIKKCVCNVYFLLCLSSSFIFFVSSSLIFFIIKVFSIELLYQGTLPPVHRWGFSTSAVAGPQQGGRLALPPGVATQKLSKHWSTESSRGKVLTCSTRSGFLLALRDMMTTKNTVRPYALKT